jgi:hypothetical protein
MTTTPPLEKCPTGFLGRHRLEPRYNEQTRWPDWIKHAVSIKGITADAMEETKTYVCEVCTLCGMTVTR